MKRIWITGDSSGIGWATATLRGRALTRRIDPDMIKPAVKLRLRPFHIVTVLASPDDQDPLAAGPFSLCETLRKDLYSRPIRALLAPSIGL